MQYHFWQGPLSTTPPQANGFAASAMLEAAERPRGRRFGTGHARYCHCESALFATAIMVFASPYFPMHELGPGQGVTTGSHRRSDAIASPACRSPSCDGRPLRRFGQDSEWNIELITGRIDPASNGPRRRWQAKRGVLPADLWICGLALTRCTG